MGPNCHTRFWANTQGSDRAGRASSQPAAHSSLNVRRACLFLQFQMRYSIDIHTGGARLKGFIIQKGQYGLRECTHTHTNRLFKELYEIC